LAHPRGVYNADGTCNAAGSITHTASLLVTIDNHVKKISFSITNTGSSRMILGLAWFQHHNPHVNWRTGHMFF
ncbi:hypothetical protein B0H34DRAFT_639172, partial [Crassisporium funariophilum]